MCKRRWLLLVMWTVGGAALHGQSLERLTSGTDSSAELARMSRLRTRADSLLREWRRANVLADLVDSVDRARAWAATDTIRVGALSIIANSSPLPLREAAVRLWSWIDSLYGVEAQYLEHRPLFVLAVDPDTTAQRPVVRGRLVVPWDLDESALALLLLSNVEPPQADPGLQAWLGGAVRPSIHPERQRARGYIELVTAPSEAARQCYLRQIESCRRALDLLGSAEPLLQLYRRPAERRAVVTRFLSSMSRGAHERAFHACTNGSDSACVEVLRSVPRHSVPPPLSHEARRTLVDVALQLGGRDAYHRLVADPDSPMPERLADAAGVGIDSVIATWQAQIVASRPPPVSLPPWGFLVATGWAALFAACGLRSSRWRVN